MRLMPHANTVSKQKGCVSNMYKLLIVDDNCYERQGIAKLECWEQFGFGEIFFAEDGTEGLEIALREKPLLVITDVSMPQMDGLEMSQKIYEQLPDTKFIFMSCFDDSEYVRGAIDVNAHGYILKPINIGKLYGIIERILKINALEQEKQDKISILEHQIKEDLPILRNQLIRDMFYGNLSDFRSDNINKFGLEIKNYYSVAIMQIDAFEEISRNEETDKIYFNINKIVNKFLRINPLSRIYGIVLNKKQIGIIIFLDTACDLQEAEEETLTTIGSIKKEIDDTFIFGVSVCIGGISDRAEDIHMLFEKAENVFEASLFAKKNSIVFASEIKSDRNMFDYSVAELEKEIAELLELGDSDNIAEFVDKYYNTEKIQNREVVKRFTAAVVGVVQLVLFKMNENFCDVFGDDYIIWEKLSKFDSILDLRQWVYNILFSISDFIKDKKSSRHMKLINRIKEIINEDISKIDSVNAIAEKLYISTVHANTIFKKYMGETIFDYLTKVKIEKAKAMLKEENSRVYEISAKLGYKSKTYFSTLFKEYTGMTPREYREYEDENK